MFRRLFTPMLFLFVAALLGAWPGSDSLLGAQTIASYAGNIAHRTIGSAQTLNTTAFGGSLPGDLAAFSYAIAEDSAGNIYFANANEIDMLYTADIAGQVPPLLAFAAANASTSFTPQKGTVYLIAGGIGQCSASTCGDGSYAVNALLSVPVSIAFDSAGSLYIADELDYAIRKVDQGNGLITTVAGDPNHSISASSADGVTAANSTFIDPSSVALQGGNIFIADTGANVVRKIGTDGLLTTIAGDLTQPGVLCTDTACGEGQAALGTVLGGVNSIAVSATGELYLMEYADSVVRKVASDGTIHTVAGTRGTACSSSSCGDNGPATSALLNGYGAISLTVNEDLVIADTGDNAIRAVRKSDGNIFTIAGSITQSPSVTQAQEAAGDGQVASQLMFNTPQYAFIDATGKLLIGDLQFLWSVDAPVVKQMQTIEFPALSPVTYGPSPVALSARSIGSDGNVTGLPITYTVAPAELATISGSNLTINGAGTVTITANQVGNATFDAAVPMMQTLTIEKAPLSIVADSLSFTYLSAPALPTLMYHVTGLVRGDTQTAVLTGRPVLQTTATPTSPSGEYPITLTLGTLAATNYALTPLNGTLTITGGATQTITFNALPDVTYGAPAITLSATSSSGLPVSFTFSGPALLSGSRLVVNGTGTVSVTASQTGDANFGAATPVPQSFHVLPAMLTITANNATREYNHPDAPFSYTPTGFVNADTAAVLSGAPLFVPPPANALPGQYPLSLDPSGGTLFAANYSFRFAAGTLTVTKGSQTISFPQIPDTTYGTQGVLWNATSSSGLPVTITASGPIRYSQLTFDAIPSDGSVAIGTVTVTATQAGSDLYGAAAPITQTFQTTKASVLLLANDATRAFGSPNPTFTYYLVGGNSLGSLANTYSGLPDVTTVADASSPQGTYPIVLSQGTLQSPVYNFQFVNGTLTVLPLGSFTLTATPSALTVPIGQSASVKLTLTPLNDFGGSVTIGCTGLPAGVTCVLSPQTLTPIPISANAYATGAVSGVLTIVAGGGSASVRNERGISLAGMLWLPCLPAGLLIGFYRRRLVRAGVAQRLLLLIAMLLPLGSLAACSSGSKGAQNNVQPGNSTIQVVGSGVAADGSTVMNQLNLTVTLQ